MMSGGWGVLGLFSIPFGVAIPAGVLLARDRHIGWPAMTLLYLVSDLILALWFEQLLRYFRRRARSSPRFERARLVFRAVLEKTTSPYGTAGGPLALIMVAYGVDPMTGRTAAAAAGHGFFSGWALAITGDMLYFVTVMASTLWLDSMIGNSFWTMVVMLVLMYCIPKLFERRRAAAPGAALPASAADRV